MFPVMFAPTVQNVADSFGFLFALRHVAVLPLDTRGIVTQRLLGGKGQQKFHKVLKTDVTK